MRTVRRKLHEKTRVNFYINLAEIITLYLLYTLPKGSILKSKDKSTSPTL